MLKSSRSLSVSAFAGDNLPIRDGSSGVFDRIGAAETFSCKGADDPDKIPSSIFGPTPSRPVAGSARLRLGILPAALLPSECLMPLLSSPLELETTPM